MPNLQDEMYDEPICPNCNDEGCEYCEEDDHPEYIGLASFSIFQF